MPEPLQARPNFNFRLAGFAADGNCVAFLLFTSVWSYIFCRALVAAA